MSRHNGFRTPGSESEASHSAVELSFSAPPVLPPTTAVCLSSDKDDALIYAEAARFEASSFRERARVHAAPITFSSWVIGSAVGGYSYWGSNFVTSIVNALYTMMGGRDAPPHPTSNGTNPVYPSPPPFISLAQLTPLLLENGTRLSDTVYNPDEARAEKLTAIEFADFLGLAGIFLLAGLCYLFYLRLKRSSTLPLESLPSRLLPNLFQEGLSRGPLSPEELAVTVNELVSNERDSKALLDRLSRFAGSIKEHGFARVSDVHENFFRSLPMEIYEHGLRIHDRTHDAIFASLLSYIHAYLDARALNPAAGEPFVSEGRQGPYPLSAPVNWFYHLGLLARKSLGRVGSHPKARTDQAVRAFNVIWKDRRFAVPEINDAEKRQFLWGFFGDWISDEKRAVGHVIKTLAHSASHLREREDDVALLSTLEKKQLEDILFVLLSKASTVQNYPALGLEILCYPTLSLQTQAKLLVGLTKRGLAQPLLHEILESLLKRIKLANAVDITGALYKLLQKLDAESQVYVLCIWKLGASRESSKDLAVEKLRGSYDRVRDALWSEFFASQPVPRETTAAAHAALYTFYSSDKAGFFAAGRRGEHGVPSSVDASRSELHALRIASAASADYRAIAPGQ